MEQIWGKVKSVLKSKVGERDYESWIKPVEYVSHDDASITVKTPNNFYRKWFLDNYLSLTLETLMGLTGKEVQVIVDVADTPLKGQMSFGSRILGRNGSEAEGIRPKKQIRAARLPENRLNPKHTFDNFIEGPSNQLARAASLSVATKPGKSFNPFFIYGGTGLGKTHLINAIGNKILSKNPEMKVVSMTSEAFMNEMISAIHHNRVNAFRNKYRNCDCLMIDDIQFLAKKERTQEEFFHTFNSLHESGSQIVLTSDRKPKEIPDIEERLRTRFSWGLVADIQPPELETRLAILQKNAQEENITLPDDVAFFLASKFVDNVRALEGAFIRLSAFVSFNGGEVNLEVAKQVLRNMIEVNDKPVTIEMVQKSVCEYFKVKMTDLKSSRRYRLIAVPRQIGMYLSRELTNSSFPDIGQQFGGRDHSTVMHACKKIKTQADEDPTLSKTLETLEKTIRG